jgi:hypothetical protein
MERTPTMSTYSFDSAQTFIWNNARLIDRRRFAYHFLNDPAEEVVLALKAYQNRDGGFGNALEPDKRDPHSQPVDVEVAFNVLDEIGMMSNPEVQRDLVLPACDFLASVSTTEGGVPFALPSARDYPHAPWWGADDSPPADLNPTADLAGLLLKHNIQHAWLEQAVPYCWSSIEATDTEQYHTLMPVISFLKHAPDQARAQHELERVLQRIRKPGIVEYDPNARGYVKMPLDWAPTPAHPCRRLFDDAALQTHLQALAERQMPDGGWPISWDPISPAVEFEWRGAVTVNALLLLKAYGF